MTNRRPNIIVAAVVFAAVVWYLFRPELLFIDRVANDAAPMGSMSPASATMSRPMIVASGHFTSDAHPTQGTASIHRSGDGRTILRLTEFSTSNGPDVHVYLVATDSIGGSRAVKRAAIIDLGSIKGNLGDQNYEVPAGTDLTRYRAVSIWCKRFSVNFGAASLR